MATAHGPETLQEAILHFSNLDVCQDALVASRWKDGVACPTCGSQKVGYIKTRRMWECHGPEKHAKRQFSAKKGTIFEDSPLGLDKWFVVIWMLASCKNGVSSYEIKRAIGVTQRTGWFMLSRIRLAMQNRSFEKFSGRVEVDETYIGAKARNMSMEKRRRVLSGHKGGHIGKIAVQGMLERATDTEHSKVSVRIVKGARREHLMPNVIEHIEPQSEVYTDALKSYELMPDAFVHQMIDHAQKYVNGQIHTNGLENFWALLKRTLNGTYVSVEPFHLFRYLDEQAFRFNTRKSSDAARFRNVLDSTIGRQLTYAELTAAKTH